MPNTLHSQCRGSGSTPGQGTRSHIPQLRVCKLHLKIPQAATKIWCNKKKKKKKKSRGNLGFNSLQNEAHTTWFPLKKCFISFLFPPIYILISREGQRKRQVAGAPCAADTRVRLPDLPGRLVLARCSERMHVKPGLNSQGQGTQCQVSLASLSSLVSEGKTAISASTFSFFLFHDD